MTVQPFAADRVAFVSSGTEEADAARLRLRSRYGDTGIDDAEVVVALGGQANGFPRSDGFDIVVASELMAIFCLTESWQDLKRRIGDIVIGYTRKGDPVTARELGADGAMAALLRDALAPNLVQTLEGAPAFVHGGPFANIAHGCNSRIATELAMHSADWAVTEAGFAADLGAEKFLDIKCRELGTFPAAAVLVVTCRALKRRTRELAT